VTASAGPGGTIAPMGTVAVNSGTSRTFVIRPHPGYIPQILSGNSCGGSLKPNGPAYTFTTGAVIATCRVEVTFSPKNGIKKPNAQPNTPSLSNPHFKPRDGSRRMRHV
jgi:hypothetical protein